MRVSFCTVNTAATQRDNVQFVHIFVTPGRALPVSQPVVRVSAGTARAFGFALSVPCSTQWRYWVLTHITAWLHVLALQRFLDLISTSDRRLHVRKLVMSEWVWREWSTRENGADTKGDVPGVKRWLPFSLFTVTWSHTDTTTAARTNLSGGAVTRGRTKDSDQRQRKYLHNKEAVEEGFGVCDAENRRRIHRGHKWGQRPHCNKMLNCVKGLTLCSRWRCRFSQTSTECELCAFNNFARKFNSFRLTMRYFNS